LTGLAGRNNWSFGLTLSRADSRPPRAAAWHALALDMAEC